MGCGYVGTAAAEAWRQAGHAITATTSREDRLNEPSRLVDHATLLRAESDANDLSVLNECDGLLISLAPNRSRQVDLDRYRAVYLDEPKQIGSALRARPPGKPLQVVHLSSCGVYGDQQGHDTDERASLGWTNSVNSVMASAEQSVRSLRSDGISVCILRLEGIYGPGRDVPGAAAWSRRSDRAAEW